MKLTPIISIVNRSKQSSISRKLFIKLFATVDTGSLPFVRSPSFTFRDPISSKQLATNSGLLLPQTAAYFVRKDSYQIFFQGHFLIQPNTILKISPPNFALMKDRSLKSFALRIPTTINVYSHTALLFSSCATNSFSFRFETVFSRRGLSLQG